MKIYMHSTVFEPSVGGVETVAELLLRAWIEAGVEVKISTDTLGSEMLQGDIPIIRQPCWREVLACTRWADVVFHNHPSTRWAWIPKLCHKPWYATVHTWLPMYNETTGLQRKLRSMLQRWLISSCRLIAVSEAVAKHLPKDRTQVIWNPCRFSFIPNPNNHTREIDVLFVGRLVSDKGIDLLIEALAQLAAQQCFVRTKIIGDGPLKAFLEEKIQAAGLTEWVELAQTQNGDTLRSQFASARCTVVPSRWEEPFGLVAIEALACGSIPIVAISGGLPEAVGPHGMVFANGDTGHLAELIRLATKGKVEDEYTDQKMISQWLERHETRKAANRYLDVFRQSL